MEHQDVVTSVKLFDARLWREREGLRAPLGVGVGGKEESHGAIIVVQQDIGVTPVLSKKINR